MIETGGPSQPIRHAPISLNPYRRMLINSVDQDSMEEVYNEKDRRGDMGCFSLDQ